MHVYNNAREVECVFHLKDRDRPVLYWSAVSNQDSRYRPGVQNPRVHDSYVLVSSQLHAQVENLFFFIFPDC